MTSTGLSTLSDANSRIAGLLLGISLVSFLLKYATSVVFGRALGVEHFDEYAVAVASVVLLATFAELGLGKFGLRALATYVAEGDHPRTRGYLRFCRNAVLTSSVLVAAVTAIAEESLSDVLGLDPTSEGLLFLPAVALCGVAAELAMALGRPLPATVILRLIVPVVPFIFAISAITFDRESWLRPGVALLSYGCGWAVGLLLLVALIWRSTPAPARQSLVLKEEKPWLTSGLGMMSLSLVVGILIEGSLVLSDLLHLKEADVAIYAACMETGTFVYVLVKSLDKFYLPRISAELAAGSLHTLRQIRSGRDRIMGALCLFFLVTLVLFGRSVLGLFGHDFERGYLALLLVATGTSAWTMASISQWFLAYVRGSLYVLRVSLSGVCFMVVAAFHVVPTFGLLGVAAIYAVTQLGLFVVLQVLARRTLRKLERAELVPVSLGMD